MFWKHIIFLILSSAAAPLFTLYLSTLSVTFTVLKNFLLKSPFFSDWSAPTGLSRHHPLSFCISAAAVCTTTAKGKVLWISGGCGSEVEPAFCYQKVTGRSLVRFPWSACQRVLGQDTEPQTAATTISVQTYVLITVSHFGQKYLPNALNECVKLCIERFNMFTVFTILDLSKVKVFPFLWKSVQKFRPQSRTMSFLISPVLLAKSSST